MKTQTLSINYKKLFLFLACGKTFIVFNVYRPYVIGRDYWEDWFLFDIIEMQNFVVGGDLNFTMKS